MTFEKVMEYPKTAICNKSEVSLLLDNHILDPVNLTKGRNALSIKREF